MRRVEATLNADGWDSGVGDVPRELIERSVHELQWPEYHALIDIRRSLLALDTKYVPFLEAFEPDWTDREYYQRYRIRTEKAEDDRNKPIGAFRHTFRPRQETLRPGLLVAGNDGSHACSDVEPGGPNQRDRWTTIDDPAPVRGEARIEWEGQRDSGTSVTPFSTGNPTDRT